jgi:hypothetical protein
MSAPPLAQAQVMHLARILIGDVPGVADEQGADPVSHGKGDRLPGGFMLGLVDAASMTTLGLPEPGPVTPPAARPTLTRLGGTSRRLGLAGLLVAEVQVALGPDRPARHQQRDCSNLINGIRKGPGEPYPQCRTASGDWQPHPSPLHQERAAVPADGNQAAFAAGEPGSLLLIAPSGGLVPSVAVAAQHRPCPHRRQLSEAVSPRQLSAERLIADDRRQPAPESLSVGIQQPRPHVTS